MKLIKIIFVKFFRRGRNEGSSALQPYATGAEQGGVPRKPTENQDDSKAEEMRVLRRTWEKSCFSLGAGARVLEAAMASIQESAESDFRTETNA